jgi:co-chaperonin GroES (HSP10)
VSSLLIPTHVAQKIKAERTDAVARSIQATSANRLNSDDFVTPDEVRQQLDELQRYVAARREEDPDYHLPKPSGWKITVLMLTIPEVSSGGLVIVEDVRETRSMSSPQGVILAVGPSAYTDPTRFSVDGNVRPWHAVGDRILWTRYDATMFHLANGQRIGIMNDTQPAALIDKGWKVPA